MLLRKRRSAPPSEISRPQSSNAVGRYDASRSAEPHHPLVTGFAADKKLFVRATRSGLAAAAASATEVSGGQDVFRLAPMRDHQDNEFSF